MNKPNEGRSNPGETVNGVSPYTVYEIHDRYWDRAISQHTGQPDDEREQMLWDIAALLSHVERLQTEVEDLKDSMGDPTSLGL